MLLRFFIGAREKGEDWGIWDTARYEVVEAGKWVGRKMTEGGEWLGEQLGLDAGDEPIEEAKDNVAPATDKAAAAASAPVSSDNAIGRAWNSALGGLSNVVRSSTGAIASTLTSPSSITSRRASEPGTWSTVRFTPSLSRIKMELCSTVRFSSISQVHRR